jgi:hypothetical protein
MEFLTTKSNQNGGDASGIGRDFWQRPPRTNIRIAGAVLALCALLVGFDPKAIAGHDDNPDYPAIDYNHKAINYDDTPADDAIGRLSQKLEKGEAKLEFDPRFGYLSSLLKYLNINVDSRLLVFSKTSFQASRISPAQPRAVFFNDHAAVGSVQHGQVFELMALDPHQGEIFYTLDMQKSDKPVPHREGLACLACHYGPATLNIPGLVVSSGVVTADGSLMRGFGAFATDHRTPIADRWGGWYLTQNQGTTYHRGNIAGRDPRADRTIGDEPMNLKSLKDRFDTSTYLADKSDVVALMTLEHQTRMTNLIIRLGWETRIAAEEKKSDTYSARLDSIVHDLVTYMVFADEARLPQRVEGSSTFSKTFPERGPRDSKGRSLRDFDLQTRLFRYPVSYMIYSDAFDALPPLAKDAVYRRLFDVLTGRDKDEETSHASPELRTAALEILRETKSGLPDYWKVH